MVFVGILMKNWMNIAYYMSDSLHYLPTILPLLKETGGILLTLNKKTAAYIGTSEEYRDTEVRYFKKIEFLKNYVAECRIDILVQPSFTIRHFIKIRNLKHVQIFHGTSDKPFNFHKSLGKYDLITVPGHKMKEDIVKTGYAPAEKVFPIGYAKVDSFLHSNFDGKGFQKEIGIDPGKATVLYTPTWADPDCYSSFSKFLGKILKDLKPYNVIIKPHSNILRYRPWLIFKASILKGKNVFLFPNTPDVLPFMAISNLMITDISSVSHEYLPFDKPMVFLSPKAIDSIPEEHRWIWRCGDVIEDKRDVYSVVKENLENSEKYKKERDDARKQIFLDFDGKSALRFKEALMKLRERIHN
jgi:CDP-glycerol glycerophosphotransferase (TagB/SpsB family)